MRTHIRRSLPNIKPSATTPELTFFIDDSIEYGVNMSKKIDELIEKRV